MRAAWYGRTGPAREVLRVGELTAAVAGVAEALKEGALRPTIAERLPLDRIAEAHERIERPRRPGRILLEIAPGRASAGTARASTRI